MRKVFKHGLLWRNKMIEQWRAQGHLVNQGDSLTPDAFKKALLEKLVEETGEVIHAKTAQEMSKEIADVYEVLDTIIHVYALSKDEIFAHQNKKREERGIFTANSFVQSFSPVQGSEQEAYCLRNVHRAPEVFE